MAWPWATAQHWRSASAWSFGVPRPPACPVVGIRASVVLRTAAPGMVVMPWSVFMAPACLWGRVMTTRSGPPVGLVPVMQPAFFAVLLWAPVWGAALWLTPSHPAVRGVVRLLFFLGGWRAGAAVGVRRGRASALVDGLPAGRCGFLSGWLSAFRPVRAGTAWVLRRGACFRAWAWSFFSGSLRGWRRLVFLGGGCLAEGGKAQDQEQGAGCGLHGMGLGWRGLMRNPRPPNAAPSCFCVRAWVAPARFCFFMRHPSS